MKRALFDTVTVLPFASGNVVDRTGYESAVLAVTVEASQTATIKVETADSTAGPYEPVKDGRIFVDNRSMRMARPSSRTKPKLRLWRTSTLT